MTTVQREISVRTLWQWREVVRRLMGALWFLSWFELYLEVFRHHHVRLPLLTQPSARFDVGFGAHAGGWVRAVITCSVLAPMAFAILTFWNRARREHLLRSSQATPHASFPLALSAMLFGIGLSLLGGVNQLMRRPPLAIDLTMRRGNGGFIVLGAALALFGILLRHVGSRISESH